MIPLTVALLAGGLGSRLRSITGERPKAMAEIDVGVPMLQLIVEHWVARGAQDILLCLGYGSEDILRWLEKYRPQAVTIRASVEPEPLGTGGALRWAGDLLPVEFIVTNADTVVDIDLRELATEHRRQNNDATLVVSTHNAGAGDLIACHPDGQIASITRHDSGNAPIDSFTYAGVTLLRRKLLDHLARGASAGFERDVMLEAMKRGNRVGTLRTRLPYRDLGTPLSLNEYRHLIKPVR